MNEIVIILGVYSLLTTPIYFVLHGIRADLRELRNEAMQNTINYASIRVDVDALHMEN